MGKMASAGSTGSVQLVPSRDRQEADAQARTTLCLMPKMGTVYTETVVHAAPAAFAEEAPYQVAIVQLDDGSRTTARIVGPRVNIGDAVIESDPLHNAPAFRKV